MCKTHSGNSVIIKGIMCIHFYILVFCCCCIAQIHFGNICILYIFVLDNQCTCFWHTVNHRHDGEQMDICVTMPAAARTHIFDRLSFCVRQFEHTHTQTQFPIPTCHLVLYMTMSIPLCVCIYLYLCAVFENRYSFEIRYLINSYDLI